MAKANVALDLDLFDVQKSGYIPQEEPERKVRKPKLLKSKPVSRAQTAAEARESLVAAIKACSFALAAFIVIGSLIFFRVQVTNLQIDLTEAKNNLSIAQSENVSLQMKYNSLMAIDKVEEYAQSKLGMVRRESYQIDYFDISDEGGAQLTNR
ncbi:MAG: hypothetical protein IIU80_00240 [Clostridia bacterium]|nr:hypothetical protein [Clostridia bacterium]